MIGTETLCNLFSTLKPSTKSIKALYQKLREHIKQQLIAIAQYKAFHSYQHEGESLSAFYAALRRLSMDCEFKTFLDESLMIYLYAICWVIRQRLFSEKTLELTTAVQMTMNMEQVSLETQAIKDVKTLERSSNDVESTCSSSKTLVKTNVSGANRNFILLITYVTMCQHV